MHEQHSVNIQKQKLTALKGETVAEMVKNLPAIWETQVPSWFGKIPCRTVWQPLQYSYLENSMDRRVWWATAHGVAKNGTQLSDKAHKHCYSQRISTPFSNGHREGNGTPLQYSCHGKSHGQRSLVGCSPWGRTESDTTEATQQQQQ